MSDTLILDRDFSNTDKKLDLILFSSFPFRLFSHFCFIREYVKFD